ncbi:MAG: hypothetical protein GXX96_38985 [Planctomycetaceae bacterium]|nr:hypothetical protein [Planctomycetaceae bacterium]
MGTLEPQSGTISHSVTPTVVPFRRLVVQAWQAYKCRWGVTFGILLLALVCAGVIGFLIEAPLQGAASSLALASGLPYVGYALCVVFLILNLIVSLLQLIVQVFLLVGVVRCLLSIAKGERTRIYMLFSGGRKLPQALGGTFLFLGTTLAVMLLLVGGIVGPLDAMSQRVDVHSSDAWPYVAGFTVWGVVWFLILVCFAVTFGFFLPVLIERKCGIWESFRVSRRITRGNRFVLSALVVLFLMVAFGIAAGAIWLINALVSANTTPFTVAAVLASIVLSFYLLFVVAVIVPYSAVLYVTAYLAMSGQEPDLQGTESTRVAQTVPPK